jgi:tRNA A37 threonylcarbamoyltransferase TsaD
LILGIEASCGETAEALVSPHGEILANVVACQWCQVLHSCIAGPV